MRPASLLTRLRFSWAVALIESAYLRRRQARAWRLHHAR